MTNGDDVIEELFSKARGLENFPQIPDPMVDVHVCVRVSVCCDNLKCVDGFTGKYDNTAMSLKIVHCLIFLVGPHIVHLELYLPHSLI